MASVNAPLAVAPLSQGENYRPDYTLQRYLWEFPLEDFSLPQYEAGVEALFAIYEQTSGKQLVPGPKGLVAIKVYTESGPGLMTPKTLTSAVIKSLQARGFSKEQIRIVGLYTESLRSSGYLPPIGSEADAPLFEGVQVVAVDSGDFYKKQWFYDSNLPSLESNESARTNRDLYRYETDPDERKSYLNTLLLQDADFWINLPVAMDNSALGVSCALANASVWNISNNRRFFESPANAPVAVAEICAIPELRDTWALTILSLERYQYLGGPRFNAVYTGREPRLWLSANPVAIDYLMWLRFKPLRARYGYTNEASEPPLFPYASSLGLGEYRLDRLELQRLPSIPTTAAGDNGAEDNGAED